VVIVTKKSLFSCSMADESAHPRARRGGLRQSRVSLEGTERPKIALENSCSTDHRRRTAYHSSFLSTSGMWSSRRRGPTFSIRCIMCIVGLAGASELSSAFSEPSMLGGLHNNGIMGLRDLHVTRNGAVRPLAYTSRMAGVSGTTSERPKVCEATQKSVIATPTNIFTDTSSKKHSDSGSAIPAETLLQHVHMGSISEVVEAEVGMKAHEKNAGAGMVDLHLKPTISSKAAGKKSSGEGVLLEFGVDRVSDEDEDLVVRGVHSSAKQLNLVADMPKLELREEVCE
jgi:hypothetical protein